ncbi:hypothetical protein [Azotobacter vinelandii]|uniref:hypothetical protein n=1 Tax=Azotobacter vinelandii TaxID=354 RepID=UPI0026670681|nr:hypothetical protein [Azotobacter vinelandii]WKN24013.1 hypothetical protein AVAEIV_002151 [Azotobacter vinelandii]
MTDSPALQPMAYVCVVSGYNLPELESCLTRRPSDVLLVTSDGLRDAARRLQQRLEKVLPGVQVHPLDQGSTGRPLGGDDVIEAQHWIDAVLRPRLLQPDLGDRPHILNLTGGTKAMIAALLDGHAWQQLDYKAIGQAELQILRPLPEQRFELLERRALIDVGPLDVAALHADHVFADPPNPILLRHPQASLELARAIWQAQAQTDAPLQRLFESLEWVWVHRRDDSQLRRKQVRLDWSDFLRADTSPTEELQDWLRCLQKLEPKALHWDATGIELPGNNPRKAHRDLRDWISGIWLEQLAHHWLREAGIPETAIARNLKSGNEQRQSASQREADLLVHQRGNTHLVEIKAGLPPGHAPGELENQVSSLGSRFGRTRKALLVSPQLRRQLQNQERWENFELRCQANDVRLLASREGLLDFIRRRSG